MKFFTKNESIFISLVLFLIASMSIFNMQLAQIRARDSSRRDLTRSIQSMLIAYREGNGFYPLSDSEGKIKACSSQEFQKLLSLEREILLSEYMDSLSSCRWGEDSLVGYLSENMSVYAQKLPADPGGGEEINFRYLSTGSHFQIFTALEGGVDAEQFDKQIYERNLKCGDEVCNFGYSSEGTPLNISLEEYEDELAKKELLK